MRFTKIDGALMPVSPEDQAKFAEIGGNVIFECEIVSDKQRTLTQNKALHLYFTMLADALNDAGWDQRRTVRADLEIPWSSYAIKENLWRPVQVALEGYKSTAEMKTATVGTIYDIVSREISSRTGVNVEFPSYR